MLGKVGSWKPEQRNRAQVYQRRDLAKQLSIFKTKSSIVLFRGPYFTIKAFSFLISRTVTSSLGRGNGARTIEINCINSVFLLV